MKIKIETTVNDLLKQAAIAINEKDDLHPMVRDASTASAKKAIEVLEGVELEINIDTTTALVQAIEKVRTLENITEDQRNETITNIELMIKTYRPHKVIQAKKLK